MRDLAELEIRLQRHNTPASLEDIANYQAEFGLEIPESYKHFLLSTMGGYPEVGCLNVNGRYEYAIGWFYTCKTEDMTTSHSLRGESSNLWQGTLDLRETFDFRIGTNLIHAIPFACDGGGNIFYIDTQEDNSIYFYDNETEKSIRISDSFESFIDALEDPNK
jgi:SMI1 / KNR4 family (SUKH-1)